MNTTLNQFEQLSVSKLDFKPKSKQSFLKYIKFGCLSELNWFKIAIIKAKEAFKISKSAETLSSKGSGLSYE